MYLTKVDLTNCYWAIRLPARWRRIFTIQVQNTKYRVTRLPFRWKFSPSVYQMLVERLARAAMKKGEGLPKTYLDDMLLQRGTRKASKRATRRLTRKLTKAGFIISPKSDLWPRRSIDFVGKIMSPKDAKITNTVGATAAVIRGWLKTIAKGKIGHKQLRSLLGKMGWTTRPLGGSSPFLAGAYRAMHDTASTGAPAQFTRALQRSMALAIMLSCLGHRFHPRAPEGGMTIFSDAAECRSGRFRIGITGRYGPYKSFLCPKWVTTLQQGELWGVYIALKIAVYIAENARGKGAAEQRAIAVGTDSEASRY